MINVHDTNDDENLEYLDAGGTVKCLKKKFGIPSMIIGPSRVHAPVQPSGH